tara:strand:- start:380 stop:553 length:174 start_codon:yes stop_codon:yes gene_type:complete
MLEQVAQDLSRDLSGADRQTDFLKVVGEESAPAMEDARFQIQSMRHSPNVQLNRLPE